MRSIFSSVLDPALRLFRLGRLRAEAVDERLQVRDLPLLLRVGRLLQRELRCTLALEGRIVAGVGVSFRPSTWTIVCRDRVEEIAVVRDEQQRAGIARRASPRARARRRGRGGWWARRAAAGRSAHISACARLRRMRQPPEKLATGSSCRASANPEAREQRRRRATAPHSRRSPRSGGAARRARARRSACASLLGRERRLDVAQLDVAVEHELDRRASRPPAFPARRARSSSAAAGRPIPASGEQLAAQQREQARLAAAVRSDDADLMAGMHGHRRVSRRRSAPRASVRLVRRIIEQCGDRRWEMERRHAPTPPASPRMRERAGEGSIAIVHRLSPPHQRSS